MNINNENEDQYKYISLIKIKNKNKDSLKSSKKYFVFPTNSKYKKYVLKKFKIFYSKLNSNFLEDLNENNIFIQKIKQKVHNIDKYVINYMYIHGIDKVRGGSYINKHISYGTTLDIIEKYNFCENCEKGNFYCLCPCIEEFRCECCHRTEYFSSIEALKKHEIEIKKKERIMEKNSRCDYCHEKGHYKEHCDNVTRWPRRETILGNSDYYSDTDSD